MVIGSGLMGTGIAQVMATAGLNTTVRDVSVEALEKGKNTIERQLNRRVEKGALTREAADNILSHITFTSAYSELTLFDLVIEAATENLNIKKSIFKELSSGVRKDCILATNTSSISIAEIASVVEDSSRFVGMHFFSPVPVMKLLEIVKSIATADEIIETIKDFGTKIGKICIVAKDRPAFIVNRMLDPMINEAISLVEQGIGSVEDIDAGMKYGCNHPMGPLELIDMAGIDIELAVMEVLYRETGDPKYRPCALLKDMVRMNWLGRKTGKGFYIYHEDGTRTVNPDL